VGAGRQDDRFSTEDGEASLRDLFRGRSQLLVYHFMFGPDWSEGCPSCSSVADGFDGIRVHLEHHGVTLMAVSRAPVEKLIAYRRRMGWGFPWASSSGSDFTIDYGVSFTAESVAPGAEYNYRRLEGPLLDPGMLPLETRAQQLRTRGRRRLPHLLGVRPWHGRPVGDVAVARPATPGTQRGGHVLVPSPRRVPAVGVGTSA